MMFDAQFTIVAKDSNGCEDIIHTELLQVTFDDIRLEFLRLESSFGYGAVTVGISRG